MEVVAHLATLDLVPPLNKVLHNIENNGAINCHVHLTSHVSFRETKELPTSKHTSCHGMRGVSSTEIVSLT